jgi:hypothetical protein
MLDRFEHRNPPAPDRLRPRGYDPGIGEPELVAGPSEHRSRLLSEREQLGAPLLASVVPARHLRGDARRSQTRTQLTCLIAGGGCARASFAGQLARGDKLA